MHNLPNNNETDIIRNIFNTSVKLQEGTQMKQPPRGAPAPGDVYSEEGILGGAKELGKMVGSMFDMSDDPSQLSREQRNLDHVKKLTQDPRNMPNLLRTGQVERSLVNEPAPAPDKSGLTTRRFYVPAGVDPKTVDPDQPIRVPADAAASAQAKLVNKNTESTPQPPQTPQAPQSSKPALQLKSTSSYTTGASTETNAPLTTKMSPTSPTGAVSPDTKWQPSQPKKSMDDVMKSVMDVLNKPSRPTTPNKSLGGLGDAFGMGTTDALRSRTDAAVNKFAGSPSSKPAAPANPTAKPAAKPAPVGLEAAGLPPRPAKPASSSQSPFEAPPEPDQQPQRKQDDTARLDKLSSGYSKLSQTMGGKPVTWENSDETIRQAHGYLSYKGIHSADATPEQLQRAVQVGKERAAREEAAKAQRANIARRNGFNPDTGKWTVERDPNTGEVTRDRFQELQDKLKAERDANQERWGNSPNNPKNKKTGPQPVPESYYRRLANLFEETREPSGPQVNQAAYGFNPRGGRNARKAEASLRSGMWRGDSTTKGSTRNAKKERNVGKRELSGEDIKQAVATLYSAAMEHPEFRRMSEIGEFGKADIMSPSSSAHKALLAKYPEGHEVHQASAKILKYGNR